MKYVFDNNSLSTIFKFYYPDRFPSFWKGFHQLVDDGEIVSVREVKWELQNVPLGEDIIKELEKLNNGFFLTPSNEELRFIREIYEQKNFQQNLETKKRLRGGAFADPFIIAKAHENNAIVITQEAFKENAAKIPNICYHFEIQCMNLEGFLKNEGWQF